VFTLTPIDPIDPIDPIAASLRPLRIVCAALAGSVALYAVAGWVLLEGMAYRPQPGLPRSVPVAITMFAMIMILLSSRLRTNILRKALAGGIVAPVNLDRLLEAYRRATLISFAMLEGAALLGMVVALLSGTIFYGIALGAASFVAMLTRWPQVADVDRIARGRRSP
jgi:hypothetical protein